MKQSLLWLTAAACVAAFGFTMMAVMGSVDILAELLFLGAGGCVIIATLTFVREQRGLY
jgi:hypothetical protein